MTKTASHKQMDTILRAAPVIPVLTIRRIDDAVPLAEALFRGGLRVLEVTFRTDIAAQAIQSIRQALPEAIVGAGTILDAGDLEQARMAGAHFGVSPGLNSKLTATAAADGLPFLPGVATASEIMEARALGYRHLKFFPAEAMGGTATLGSFAGPFPDVWFCPTGGIREEMLEAYLRVPNVLCVGGSWFATAGEIEIGAWTAITERALRCRSSV
jgi:2-dehydro-3-deoxyphosphogluconate aldolase / (4S)-4-hydroxy-2-oxoglutarate aldolase